MVRGFSMPNMATYILVVFFQINPWRGRVFFCFCKTLTDVVVQRQVPLQIAVRKLYPSPEHLQIYKNVAREVWVKKDKQKEL
ncbi:hypothetical protein C5167_044331 [Papaver somniferum]|uniref:Uncharacterized protein n=1 Tax=Papaver somniferum TaxID=3469 RepID=A0A4Y7L959_PAPSO|nr:hypothetical protein C5167_044331 [Papaver somniferum]